MVTRRARHAERGMTIVELLIALVLSAMVTAGIYSFFVGQRNVYNSQSHIAEAQLNGHTALEMISRMVRDAGQGFVECVAWCPVSGGFGPGVVSPVTAADAAPPNTGLRAFNGLPVGLPNTIANSTIRIPPLWIQNGANGAPDAIAVAYGAGASGAFVDAPITADVTTATGTVSVPLATVPAFADGDFIIVTDTTPGPNGATGCVPERGCTLFQITGTPTSTLPHASSSKWNAPGAVLGLIPSIPYPPPQGLTLGYIAGASPQPGVRNIGQLVWALFRVDTAANPPALTMTRLDGNAPGGAQVLATGIEDLQIAYGCDNDANGLIDEGANSALRMSDEWFPNVASDNEANAACARPDAVRMTITARSVEPDTILSNRPANARIAVEDGTAGVNDTFHHRPYQTVVYPRNNR